MTKTISTLSPDEAKTRDLFREAVGRRWTQERQIVRLVFEAQHVNALPIDRIERIGAALANVTDCNLRGALDSLVRDGVLRRRRDGRETFWEVNY